VVRTTERGYLDWGTTELVLLVAERMTPNPASRSNTVGSSTQWIVTDPVRSHVIVG